MSRARDLSRFANNQAISVDSSLNVGINSSSPDAKLDVVGVVSATEFYGDGSNLTGVSSPGLGTALSDDTTSPLNSIYFTNANLSVASTITVNPPASASAAFTQYANIVLQNDADLIVADGDTFIPDILGIGTGVEEPGTLAGGAGKLRVDNITDKAGTGAPNFPNGVVITGLTTATGGVQVATGATISGSTNTITALTNSSERLRITSNGAVIVAGTTAYSDGTFGEAKLQFNAKTANHIGACGVADTTSSISHVLFKNPNGAIASVGTADSDFIALTGNVERLRIDSGGRVTMPYQPCFWATSTSGDQDSSEGYTGIISNNFDTTQVNVGNHFNTSTGVFTCPVAGVYEFHGQALPRYRTGPGRAELTFYKNGTNTVSRAYGYTYITGSGDHDNLHVMGYITCAANDEIDFRVHAMDSGIDVYWHDGLGYFSGRLVS